MDLVDISNNQYSMVIVVALMGILVMATAYIPVRWLMGVINAPKNLGKKLWSRRNKEFWGRLSWTLLNFRRARERRMSREIRDKYMRGLFADVVTNGLEEALYKGELTRHEVNHLYHLVGLKCKIPDLLRNGKEPDHPAKIKIKQQALKKDILSRLDPDKVQAFMATRKKSRLLRSA